MTEAMPFLQKAILLSYAPRPLDAVLFCYVGFFCHYAENLWHKLGKSPLDQWRILPYYIDTMIR